MIAAAVLTDALVVRGQHRGKLVALLARFDRLLCPEGGSAWKGEAGSLDTETLGLVVGVNKVLLGRHDESGRVRLVRSSDTGLGDHYLDPTGTGERLPDERTTWCAQLEELLLAELAGLSLGVPLRAPHGLPAWVDQPALRPRRASTLIELRRLRHEVGDPDVGPFARYATTFEGGPICLGTRRPPSTWAAWQWRKDGWSARIAVQLPNGDLVTSAGDGPIFVVRTIREVFHEWLREHDPTVTHSEDGLRRVMPVRSHASLVEVVGRSGEHAGEVADDDPTSFGSLDATSVVEDARGLSAAEIARRSGLAERTARDAITGAVEPTATTIARLAVAVTSGPIERRCDAGVLCRSAVDGRGAPLESRQRRWCSDACERVMARRAGGIGPRAASNSELPSRTSRDQPQRSEPAHRGRSPEIIPDPGEPSCSSCGSVFLGRIPKHCTECGGLVLGSGDTP